MVFIMLYSSIISDIIWVLLLVSDVVTFYTMKW